MDWLRKLDYLWYYVYINKYELWSGKDSPNNIDNCSLMKEKHWPEYVGWNYSFNVWRACTKKSSGDSPTTLWLELSIPEPSRIDPRSSEKYITFSSFQILGFVKNGDFPVVSKLNIRLKQTQALCSFHCNSPPISIICFRYSDSITGCLLEIPWTWGVFPTFSRGNPSLANLTG